VKGVFRWNWNPACIVPAVIPSEKTEKTQVKTVPECGQWGEDECQFFCNSEKNKRTWGKWRRRAGQLLSGLGVVFWQRKFCRGILSSTFFLAVIVNNTGCLAPA